MAKFTWPLIQQIVGVVDRDFLPYLAPFGETEPFNWYDTVVLWPEQFPALLVYEASDMLNPQSEHTFEQTVLIQCRVQLSEVDRNQLAQKMRAYLGALTQLFAHYDWGNHAADFVQPVPLPASLAQLGDTTPGMDANITRIFVSQLTYDEFGVRQGQFAMRGTAHLVVNMEEILTP